ncbi:small ribosomal subunit protein uS5m [Zonotrichia leucophrys gambelii]|uniref:Small ribosomal subunit protein uS5m n=1 Tax=Zonotrichia albicollis TaxID=44394 RepID=A0A8D2N185_ZONAL|nr:28S ribosomal protein S5, mitochondrial [Zonotrichia albicollis]
MAAAVVAAGRACARGALRAAWRGFAPVPVGGSCSSYSSLAWALQTRCSLSAPWTGTLEQCRKSSFFNTLTADQLWKGALAETGVGVKKGRGKKKKKKLRKNLNRGQEIGEGRSGFLWPGLNAPVLQTGKVQEVSQRKKEERERIQSEIIQQRDTFEKKKKIKIKREGGWSGKCWGGVILDPPDPGPNGETYEDFETRVIEVRNVFCMKAKEGRKKSVRALVAVGNGKGAAGFAIGKAGDRTNALRKAKNKAISSLHFIELYQNHTIYHDISVKFKSTKIRMKKQNKGYGLHCHRAIITLCRLIGIKDMYAKVTGSRNLINITRALFRGLTLQETHQQLADQKSLYVVEFREEQGPLPIVVALPQGPVREEPEPEDEVPNTKLEWREVKEAQGMLKSPWAGVRRAAC